MKRSIYTITAALTLGLSAPALAGPFEKFFQSAGPGLSDEVIPAKTPQRISVSYDINADVRAYLEQGYIALGNSSFVGAPTDPQKAKNQAKKLKAELVLYSSTYVDSRSGGALIMPMPFGMPGAMATPMTFHRYNQVAVYLSRLRPEKIGLGIRYKAMTVDQVRSLGTGRGILVDVLVRGAPAFDAGIIPEDIIISIAGQDVSTHDRMERIKAEYAGQSVPVEIIRGGQPQTLQITMPAALTAQAKR